MKSCPTLLTIREMQIKTTRDTTLQLLKWLLSKRQEITSVGEDVWRRGTPIYCWWECKLENAATMESVMETPQKIKNSSIHYICTYYIFIVIHPLVDTWVISLILAIENNSAMNIRVHMSSQISVFHILWIIASIGWIISILLQEQRRLGKATKRPEETEGGNTIQAKRFKKATGQLITYVFYVETHFRQKQCHTSTDGTAMTTCLLHFVSVFSYPSTGV